ncbi:hypothetical protein L210DRAFT_3571987 [Boletus edulis BED1]|uniref:Transmembrane protein n=1 Tax=Boletus edulis BED1 TaxID=1328754 RepID=A0AAD4G6J7_BOLED|nr:hypothetical protein L210DRAFT_3571987 [Boletus edulis BED1]
MSTVTLETFVLLFLFVIVEFTRAVLWTARRIDEPDHDGPLLRLLFAFLIGVLAVVPHPLWTLVMYAAWVAWIPVRAILWLWGIGRESMKRSPKAVTRWYAHTRKRRANMLRRRKEEDE